MYSAGFKGTTQFARTTEVNRVGEEGSRGVRNFSPSRETILGQGSTLGFEGGEFSLKTHVGENWNAIQTQVVRSAGDAALWDAAHEAARANDWDGVDLFVGKILANFKSGSAEPLYAAPSAQSVYINAVDASREGGYFLNYYMNQFGGASPRLNPLLARSTVASSQPPASSGAGVVPPPRLLAAGIPYAPFATGETKDRRLMAAIDGYKTVSADPRSVDEIYQVMILAGNQDAKYYTKHWATLLFDSASLAVRLSLPEGDALVQNIAILQAGGMVQIGEEYTEKMIENYKSSLRDVSTEELLTFMQNVDIVWVSNTLRIQAVARLLLEREGEALLLRATETMPLQALAGVCYGIQAVRGRQELLRRIFTQNAHRFEAFFNADPQPQKLVEDVIHSLALFAQDSFDAILMLNLIAIGDLQCSRGVAQVIGFNGDLPLLIASRLFMMNKDNPKFSEAYKVFLQLFARNNPDEAAQVIGRRALIPFRTMFNLRTGALSEERMEAKRKELVAMLELLKSQTPSGGLTQRQVEQAHVFYDDLRFIGDLTGNHSAASFADWIKSLPQ